jgi:hypothetical protein
MPKFRKRPLAIEAIQYTGTRVNAEEVYAWVDIRKPRSGTRMSSTGSSPRCARSICARRRLMPSNHEIARGGTHA